MNELPTVLTTRRAATEYGQRRVRWLVESGRWQRPGKGVVVRHSGPLTPDEHLRCELLLQGSTAAFAGLTAATLDGLKNFKPHAVFIVVASSATVRRRPGVIVRRSRQLGDSDIHPSRTPRRTRIARSIIDAASWASNDLRCQAIVAASVQQRLVTAEALAVVAHRRVNAHRHALIIETIRDVAGGSLSEYEVLFIRICRDFNLPRPTRQKRRKDSSGRWRYLDIEFDDYLLVVEIDGQQHMEVLTWWEDMARDNDLVVNGRKTVLRFAGFALRHQRDRVGGVLLQFFATRTPVRQLGAG